MKRYSLFVMMLLLCGTLLLTACQNGGDEAESTSADTTAVTTAAEDTSDESVDTEALTEADTEEVHETTTSEAVTTPVSNTEAESRPEDESKPVIDEETVAYLTFSGTEVTSSVEGAITADGSIFLISKPGTYELSGTLDGQLRVQVEKTEDVTLVLNNFTATCSFSAPLYIVSADEATIQMPEGTVNRFTDAVRYDHGDTKPNACIYSADDLIIRGKGSLTVNGQWNNGIGCKNDLVLRTGSFTVSAVNNAIKGNDSVTVENGATVTVLDAEDGIKSDNIVDVGKGFILICEESQLSITCEKDALQSTQALTVEAGCLVQYACGTPTQCDGTVDIADGTLVAINE